MSKSLNTLIATLLAAFAGNAVAASSVDLAVKGTITPSACTPSFANGGVIDFGKFSATTLNVETKTRLETQYLQVRVDCAAATVFALKGDDNREGSVPDTYEGNYGLGLINGNEKLGSFYVGLASAVADDQPARFIGSFDGGASWVTGGALAPRSEYIAAVANHSSVTPMATKVLTGEMSIHTIIVPAKDLTLTSEVPMDGSLTLAIIYL